MLHAVQYSHRYLGEVLERFPDGFYIDATLGNGNDTKFILTYPDFSGQVVGFDIQDQAIEKSKARLSELPEELQKRVTLYKESHGNIDRVLKGIPEFHGAIFNLGYLPSGDKSVTTVPESTLAAIDQIKGKLVVGGRIIVVIYWGHPQGQIERNAVLEAAKNYPQEEFQVTHYEFINQINCPPSVMVVERVKFGEG